MDIQPFDVNDPAHVAAAARIWNTACGPHLAISERFIRFNCLVSTDRRIGSWLAMQKGQPVGFAAASAFVTDPLVSPPDMGHVDAMAVLPDFQRQGIGSMLLAGAENWLRQQGCTCIVLGASQRPFAPGVPDELHTAPFFERLGYTRNRDYGECWDMAHDLANYVTPASALKATGVVGHPAQPGDADALLGFLRREFNGGWRYEAEEYVGEGRRLSDYILLWSERGVDGCCLLTFEDSARPLDRFYPHGLPHPWGQLGSVGISADRRGRGYGAALLDAGLRNLRDNGVRGCIIDWLTLVDFYARFGFKTHRKYLMMGKRT